MAEESASTGVVPGPGKGVAHSSPSTEPLALAPGVLPPAVAGPKYKPPGVFTGEKGVPPGAVEFCLQFQYFFAYHRKAFDTDPKKLHFVAGFLREGALLWFEPLRNTFLSFEDFQSKLVRRFSPYKTPQLALDELYRLPFTGDVSSFAEAFQRLLFHCPKVDDGSKKTLFVKALPSKLQFEMRKYYLTAECTFDDVVAQALLHEAALGLEEVQLHSMVQQKQARCWICNQTGHMKKDCPNRQGRGQARSGQ